MSSPSDPTPQFSTAEFQGGPERCQLCGQAFGSSYYLVGPNRACPACAEKAKFETPKDTHSGFVRGLIFGIGGAILGLIAYSTFAIVTGIVIGYLSLLVGYVVAKAIMIGSKGIGGRRYQVTAVALTYAAVSMSAIPIGISMLVKERAAKKAHLVQHPTGGQPQSSAPQPPAQAAQDDSSDASAAASSEKTAPKMSLGAAIGALVFAGLASPFLELEDPVQGAIGLIILLVGIRIAWKMTAGKSTEILGPFNHSPASPPSQG